METDSPISDIDVGKGSNESVRVWTAPNQDASVVKKPQEVPPDIHMQSGDLEEGVDLIIRPNRFNLRRPYIGNGHRSIPGRTWRR